jgi:NADPH:quinone reductase-like Zn-dependent oxidoreductase
MATADRGRRDSSAFASCLFDHAKLKTGQTVLIHGAAGGVGSIAV